MQTRLDITERTIGYLLTHTQNDPPANHEEIVPFLADGEEEMSFMRAHGISESDLIDYGTDNLLSHRKEIAPGIKKLCEKNPFLGVSAYSALGSIYEPTAFSVLERAIVRQHYDLKQAVVDCVSDPWNTGKKRNYLLRELQEQMGIGYAKHHARGLFFLSKLAKELHQEDDFLDEMQEYAAAYKKAYNSFSSSDLANEGHHQRMGRKTAVLDQKAHQEIIDTVYPSDELRKIDEEFGFAGDVDLVAADNHVITVFSSITPKQLSTYAKRYYRGGSSEIASAITAFLKSFNSTDHQEH